MRESRPSSLACQGANVLPRPELQGKPHVRRFCPASPHPFVNPCKPALLALLALFSCSPEAGEETSGLETSSSGGDSSTGEIIPTTSGDYLPCTDDQGCPLSGFCFGEQDFGVCSKVCVVPEDCPQAEPPLVSICSIVLLPQGDQACLLSCLLGDCPHGLRCLEYRGSLFCG